MGNWNCRLPLLQIVTCLSSNLLTVQLFFPPLSSYFSPDDKDIILGSPSWGQKAVVEKLSQNRQKIRQLAAKICTVRFPKTARDPQVLAASLRLDWRPRGPLWGVQNEGQAQAHRTTAFLFSTKGKVSKRGCFFN